MIICNYLCEDLVDTIYEVDRSIINQVFCISFLVLQYYDCVIPVFFHFIISWQAVRKLANFWWIIVPACLRRYIVMLSGPDGLSFFTALIAFSISLFITRGKLLCPVPIVESFFVEFFHTFLN